MTLPRFYPIFDNLRELERTLPLAVKLVKLRIKEMPEPELRDAMVDRAEQRALQLHTTDHMVEHTLQVYREILAARENGNQAAFIQGNEYG